MALEKVPLEKLPAFGRRLMKLAQAQEIGSPSLLANALYDNYRDLVEPTSRRNKYGKNVKDSKHDIDAITRMVQKHFNEEDAYNVQGKYMYAYSKLFECSLDFLYGTVDVQSCDLDIREICNKLNIEERAIMNLIEGYDADPETFSCTRFWSKLLSSDVFSDMPYAWLHYRHEVLQCEDLKKKIAAMKKTEASTKDFQNRMFNEMQCDTLERIQPGVKASCDGAYAILMQVFSDYINLITEEWVSAQHIDLEDKYYENELKKIKILEAALKDGL